MSSTADQLTSARAMPSTPPPYAPAQVPPSQPPEDQSDRRLDEPPWRAWTAPAAVAVGFTLGLFVTAFVGLFAKAGGSSLSHPTPVVSLISDVVFDLGFVAAALYFAALQARPTPADFGIRRVRPRLAIGTVLGFGASYYVLTAIYASALHLHGKDKLPSELGAGKSTAALMGAAVFVCVIAPVVEEFFFRGFLFGALRRWRIRIAGREIGTWVAAVITGGLFGLAHTGSASSQYLIPLGFLGFVLCLVRWKTASLYPCIALHCINNCLALGVNQLHWRAGLIVALIAGALVAIGAITGPIGARSQAIV